MSRILGLLIVGVMTVAMSPNGVSADTAGAPGDVSLRIVSRDASGHQLAAYTQAISDDGRSVLLRPYIGLRLKNLRNRALTRVDLRDNDSNPVHVGRDGRLSGDARRVAFTSFAAGLTAEPDINGDLDVFVRRLGVGRTELASVAVNGGAGDDKSVFPEISPSGRYVTFASLADDLVVGDRNRRRDVFMRDLRSDSTLMVSVSDDEQLANRGSWDSSLSRDGRYVAFTSDATNLVQGDTNDSADVFVRDLVEQTTRRVSVASDGSQADRWSGHVAISGDGRYVTFASAASTLSPRDPRRDADIFVHDLASGRTRWVSELGGRTQGGTSLGPDISEHGRFVVFNSSQDRVDVSSVCSADHNVYLWDRSTRTTRCLSPTYDGSDTYGEVSYGAQIDAHGTAVAFTSTVYRLVPHDVDVNAPNVFLWRRPVETDR